MRINRWFFVFLKKSLSQRKGRVFIATVSVALATTIVVSAISISAGIREKLGRELKAYGANIMVVSTEAYLEEGYLQNLSSAVKGIEGSTGQVYGEAFRGKVQVEIIGLELEKIKGSEAAAWRINGRWPEKGEALAGINIKNMLNLKDSSLITLESEAGKMDFRISGVFERGGFEDNCLVLNIKDAQALLGLEGRVSAILIRGKTENLQEISEQLRQYIPDSEVKTLRQIAYAEESLLKKMQLLMALVTLVVLLASAISVASTMGATILERREEIGLMKAIGGTRQDIGLFYRIEAAMIGSAGGITGFVSGFILAQIISKIAFGSFIGVPIYVAAFSLALGIGITVAASYLPVKEAMRYNPAVILRGE